MTYSSEESLQRLLQSARSGDREAFGALFKELRPYLYFVANRHANESIAAEDLVSEVMSKLLIAIDRGAGPETNVRAFLAASIRNLATDHLRARSHANLSTEIVGDLPARAEDSPAERSSIELHEELSLLKTAFVRLPKKQQRVLRDVVIFERKPRALTEEYGQSANSISASLVRAKVALTQEMRRTLLRNSVDSQCLPFREELAKNGEPQTARAAAHLETCELCRGAIRKFSAIPLSLALLPIASIGLLSAESGAGVAAAATASAGPAAPTPPADSAPKTPKTPKKPNNTVLAAIGGGLMLALAALLFFLFGPPSGDADAVDPEASESADLPPSESPTDPEPSESSSPGGTSLQNPLNFDVSIEERSGETAVLIDATIDDSAQRIAVTLTLPETMRIESAPAAWNCPTTAGGGLCSFDADATSSGEIIVVSGDGTPTFGPFTFEYSAVDGNLHVAGTSEGTIVVR
ncbi:RNA polymerase sigma factor [Humidisolicoccus flavus]|uniref:RNA polymerase sigma factor n=1 Tax=Humidisolicoccus flavus TaxID=3111414 RepID=UPI0032478453